MAVTYLGHVDSDPNNAIIYGYSGLAATRNPKTSFTVPVGGLVVVRVAFFQALNTTFPTIGATDTQGNVYTTALNLTGAPKSTLFWGDGIVVFYSRLTRALTFTPTSGDVITVSAGNDHTYAFKDTWLSFGVDAWTGVPSGPPTVGTALTVAAAGAGVEVTTPKPVQPGGLVIGVVGGTPWGLFGGYGWWGGQRLLQPGVPWAEFAQDDTLWAWEWGGGGGQHMGSWQSPTQRGNVTYRVVNGTNAPLGYYNYGSTGYYGDGWWYQGWWYQVSVALGVIGFGLGTGGLTMLV